MTYAIISLSTKLNESHEGERTMNEDTIMIIAVDYIRSTYDDPTPVASAPVNGRVVVTADNGKYGVTVNSNGDVVKVEQIV